MQVVRHVAVQQLRLFVEFVPSGSRSYRIQLKSKLVEATSAAFSIDVVRVLGPTMTRRPSPEETVILLSSDVECNEARWIPLRRK